MRFSSITARGGLRLLATAILLIFCRNAGAQDSSSSLSATIATSVDSGYYQKVCKAIGDAAGKQSPPLKVTCLPTQGSLENVYALDSGKADFALVQSDVAHRAWMGELPFEEAHSGITIVAPLFVEKVHILVRPHQFLSSAAQLKGKKIWLGEVNSGTRVSASAVLEAVGLPADMGDKTILLNPRQAFALLGEDSSGKANLLQAIVESKTLSVEELDELIQSLGMKRVVLEIPGSTDKITVLFRPDLTIRSFADLLGVTVWAGKHACPHQSAVLAALEPARKLTDQDVGFGLNQLRNHQIDALIQPEQLSKDLVQAILKAHGFSTFPLTPDPRTKGRSKLMAYLGPGVNISSLAGPRDPTKNKIWWPTGNQTLDETVVNTFLPGNKGSASDRKELLDRDVTYTMALHLLALGELDAVFQTTVATSQTIADLMNRTEITLLGLDWPTVGKLVEENDTSKNGSYVETSFQKRSYPALSQSIYVVGVQTYLLAGPGRKDEKHQAEKVLALARLLYKQQETIENSMRGKGASGGKIQAEPFRLTLLGSPLKHQLCDPINHINAQAMQFLVKPGHLRHGTRRALWTLVSGVFILAGATLWLGRKRKFMATYRRWMLLVLALIFLWGVAAIWLQTVEGDITQDFSSLSDSASAFARNVLSQLQLPVSAPEPSTQAGQRALRIFTWLGALLVGTFFLPIIKQVWVGDFMARLLGTGTRKDAKSPDGTAPQERVKRIS
jgi:TRAP-type uncharacterized transport system substrate-binding protein